MQSTSMSGGFVTTATRLVRLAPRMPRNRSAVPSVPAKEARLMFTPQLS